MVMFGPHKFIQEKIVEIKNLVGEEKALVATSGGVDSSTCAVLAEKALGNRLVIMFLDDGLMREGEGEEIRGIFKKMGLSLEIKKVANRFFTVLKGIGDPEEKRKAFRKVFYESLGEIIKGKKARFLIQGTIKADIVETVAGVKTQHNVLEQIGIDPVNYGFKIVEPLRDIYKPEVRLVAKTLGLPREIYGRMPFPGPGFATRIVGKVTPERVKIVCQATKIVEEELKEFLPFQAFAVLLNDKATGVKRGKRAFGNIIVIRSVNSKDALTAKATPIPWEGLQNTQQRIVKQIPSVVRVLYELTPKPPATIEYI